MSDLRTVSFHPLAHVGLWRNSLWRNDGRYTTTYLPGHQVHSPGPQTLGVPAKAKHLKSFLGLHPLRWT